MQLHTFTVGPFAENTYLLSDDDKAILIDPGFNEPGEFGSFTKKLSQLQVDLEAVVLTHAHVDHVMGLIGKL